MKKIYLFILLVTLTSVTFGQTPIGQIFEHGVYHDVKLYEDKNKGYKIAIPIRNYMYLFKEYNDYTIVWIDNENHESFVQALKETKEKYESWIEIAKENDVKDIRKRIYILFPHIEISGTSSGQFYSKMFFIKPYFVISSFFYKLELNAYPIETLNKPSFSWDYYFSEYIDELLSIINPERIKSILSKRRNDLELFK